MPQACNRFSRDVLFLWSARFRRLHFTRPPVDGRPDAPPPPAAARARPETAPEAGHHLVSRGDESRLSDATRPADVLFERQHFLRYLKLEDAMPPIASHRRRRRVLRRRSRLSFEDTRSSHATMTVSR